MKIAFSGERGSYAEAAAARMFANEDIATAPMRNYKTLFDALAAREADYVVARLENTTTGPNTALFDHMRNRKCFLTRETRVTEVYNLAGQKGAELSDIKRVHAHPIQLAQCQDFLEKMPGIEIISRLDSASAFAQLQKAGKQEAAVCSDYAASIYGLHVIKRGIQDEAESVTRYAAIGRELEMPPNDADDTHTLILFAIKHVAGALLTVLEVMKKYNISVYQMGTRPTNKENWDYVMALEFPGRALDRPIAGALKELKGRTTYLQLLGSYDKIELGTSSGRFKPFRLPA